jgi:hypothetical protein
VTPTAGGEVAMLPCASSSGRFVDFGAAQQVFYLLTSMLSMPVSLGCL